MAELGSPAVDLPLFSVDGRAYTWQDVAAYAKLRGVWDEIVDDARAGAACLARSEPSPDRVDDEARVFRRERRLLSADDLDAWLERRGVTLEDWTDYLRRSLARVEADDRRADASEAETWAEAMCSGCLDDLALGLAERLAVDPGASLSEVDVAFGRFCAEAATDEAIDRVIASARLDWIRMRLDLAVVEDENVALEAALAVRADGRQLADAAALAGVPLERTTVWLDEVDPALASLLVGASTGELVGPVVVDDGHALAVVSEKTPVDPRDPVIRARAAAAVAQRAVRREADARVVWHEQL